MKEKLVVVTRSSPAHKPWMNAFQAAGLEPHHFPTITASPVEPSGKLMSTLRRISQFDWIVFTSAQGPRSLKNFLKKYAVTILSKDMPQIAAIGEKTAEAVRKAGGTVAFMPSQASSAALGRQFPSLTGARILLLRTTLASSELALLLQKRGAKVTDLPIYQTKFVKRPDPKFSALLAADRIGCLTFASPSAVEGFLWRMPEKLIEKAHAVPAIAIGKSTGAALKKAGFTRVATAKQPTAEAMVALALVRMLV